jgi:hypothetical protein
MDLILAYVLVHMFYSNECCAQVHCHQVPCDQVQEQGSRGWLWWGHMFDRSKLRDSPDGNCHVCVNGDASFCIYLPART